MSGYCSRLLIVLIIILAGAPVFAQRDRDTYNPGNLSFEVSGQVNVGDTNVPAHDIPVRLERFSGGIVDQLSTDSRGRFRFANLQRGYYRVIIHAPGFGPVQQEADLTVLFKVYLVFALVRNNPSPSPLLTGANDVIDARIPSEAREQYVQGRTALARKNYPEATAHLEKAIFIYSSFFEARLLLATAFVDVREWAKAESALLRALELKPDNSGATISLGEVYWRQKRFKEAEETLLAGLKLDDKSWHGHFTLGRLYWEKGDVMKTAPEVGKTLQLKPDFAEAHLLAGNVLLKVNQQQRALFEYEEYLKLAPKGEFAQQTRDLVQKLQKTIAEKK